jgi:hypothetical protein
VTELKPFWVALVFMCALGAAAGLLLNAVDASGTVLGLVVVGGGVIAGLLGANVAHRLPDRPARR